MPAACADLHLHTYYSDGTDSPLGLLELAKRAGVTALSITDHDIVEGYVEAIEPAQRLGLELLPGIEMSAATADGKEVHILGHLIDPTNTPLLEYLEIQKHRRVQRMHDMVGRLQGLGLAIEIADVMQVAGKGTLGRPHVAQALVRRGHVGTMEQAFDKYLGNTGPAFVQGSSATPKLVIDLIRAAGGIPTLAHPIYLRDDSLIDAFCRDGLLGLEVYHSSHTPDVVRRYEAIAKRLGLLRTGGTDYHGTQKEGVPVGAATVPYELVEALKRWKQEHATSGS